MMVRKKKKNSEEAFCFPSPKVGFLYPRFFSLLTLYKLKYFYDQVNIIFVELPVELVAEFKMSEREKQTSRFSFLLYSK